MPRKKARYRAALEVTTEWLRGPERPLDLPEGVPATIEVGIGSGHWLVARAKAEPHRLFVGLELKEERAYQATRDAIAAGVSNMRFMVGEASRLDPCIPAARFDELAILFPDPWPKKTDSKRRLAWAPRLRGFGRWLRPGAIGLFRTDNRRLWEYALKTVPAAGYVITSSTDDAPRGDVVTRYESRFRAEGIPIHEIRFTWPGSDAAPPLVPVADEDVRWSARVLPTKP